MGSAVMTVMAQDSVGASAFATLNVVVVVVAPSAPLRVAAVPLPRSAKITFDEPLFEGGAVIEQYSVTATPTDAALATSGKVGCVSWLVSAAACCFLVGIPCGVLVLQ